MKILESLPAKYDTIIQKISILFTKNILTLKEIKLHIKNFESSNIVKSQNHQKEMAFLAKKCNFCHIIRHIERDCRKKRKNIIKILIILKI